MKRIPIAICLLAALLLLAACGVAGPVAVDVVGDEKLEVTEPSVPGDVEQAGLVLVIGVVVGVAPRLVQDVDVTGGDLAGGQGLGGEGVVEEPAGQATPKPGFVDLLAAVVTEPADDRGVALDPLLVGGFEGGDGRRVERRELVAHPTDGHQGLGLDLAG